jgi:hypothetical protein
MTKKKKDKVVNYNQWIIFQKQKAMTPHQKIAGKKKSYLLTRIQLK